LYFISASVSFISALISTFNSCSFS